MAKRPEIPEVSSLGDTGEPGLAHAAPSSPTGGTTVFGLRSPEISGLTSSFEKPATKLSPGHRDIAPYGFDSGERVAVV